MELMNFDRCRCRCMPQRLSRHPVARQPGHRLRLPSRPFRLRLYIKEPKEFARNSMRHARTPYLLVLRFYGFRLLVVSLIWFIYDVSLSTTPLLPLFPTDSPSSLPTPLASTRPPSSPTSSHRTRH